MDWNLTIKTYIEVILDSGSHNVVFELAFSIIQ